MAPELFAAAGLRYSGASDVFAGGVMMFEILTGLRPFDGAIYLRILQVIVIERKNVIDDALGRHGQCACDANKSIHSLCASDGRLPMMTDGQQAIARYCMAYDPNDRPLAVSVSQCFHPSKYYDKQRSDLMEKALRVLNPAAATPPPSSPADSGQVMMTLALV
jgi:serine/threonine protein kinase